jgi:predicted DNA-binding transcriptional regulator AlpA
MIDQGHRRLRTPLAADYVGYAESTLEKKRVTGDGPPFIRLGRMVVYDTRDLDDWLARRRATSTSEYLRLAENRVVRRGSGHDGCA